MASANVVDQRIGQRLTMADGPHCSGENTGVKNSNSIDATECIANRWLIAVTSGWSWQLTAAALRCLRCLLLPLLLRNRCARSHPDDGVHKELAPWNSNPPVTPRPRVNVNARMVKLSSSSQQLFDSDHYMVYGVSYKVNTRRITVYCYFWAYPSFYFLVFLFLHFF